MQINVCTFYTDTTGTAVEEVVNEMVIETFFVFVLIQIHSLNDWITTAIHTVICHCQVATYTENDITDSEST